MKLKERNKWLHENIVQLYNEGYTAEEIIEQLNISLGYVLDLLKSKGIYKSKIPRYKNTEIRVLELNDGTRTAFEIAKILKAPPTAVLGILNKNKQKKIYKYAGSVFDTYQQMSEYKRQLGKKVKELSENGMANEAIAEKFEISKFSVVRFLSH